MRHRRLASPFALAEPEIDAADERLAGHMRRIAGNREGEGQGDGPGDAVQGQESGRDIGVAAFGREARGLELCSRKLPGRETFGAFQAVGIVGGAGVHAVQVDRHRGMGVDEVGRI